MPNVQLYYHEAIISAVVLWWNPQKEVYWALEKLNTSISLSEWMVTDRKGRYVHSTQMKVWNKYIDLLTPHPSLIMSFLYYQNKSEGISISKDGRGKGLD